MVLLVVKVADNDEWMAEALASDSCDSVIRNITEIQNIRERISLLCHAMRDLAKYGPMKRPEDQSLDEVKEAYEGLVISKNEFYTPDPTGVRCGNGVGPTLQSTIEDVCRDGESILSSNLVLQRQALNIRLVTEKLDNFRGASIMAFPMGLPEWESVRVLIEGDRSNQSFDPDTSEAWIAGRPLDRTQRIQDRFGANNKTKISLKLQKAGNGAPSRNPAIDEDERKAMMSHYFKRQEELKRLAEADDDDYLQTAEWANPSQLKQSLRGISQVKAPGI